MNWLCQLLNNNNDILRVITSRSLECSGFLFYCSVRRLEPSKQVASPFVVALLTLSKASLETRSSRVMIGRLHNLMVQIGGKDMRQGIAARSTILYN
jgi:hypothetical protein